MHRPQHRFLPVLAASAALAFTASPALAGSDGCSGDDCRAEATPAPALPTTPVPVVPAPQTAAPLPQTAAPLPKSEVKPEHTSKQIERHRTLAVRTRPVARRTTVVRATTARATFPRGGVGAGAGGTAPQGPDEALAALAVVLLATSTGLVLVARRRNG